MPPGGIAGPGGRRAPQGPHRRRPEAGIARWPGGLTAGAVGAWRPGRGARGIALVRQACTGWGRIPCGGISYSATRSRPMRTCCNKKMPQNHPEWEGIQSFTLSLAGLPGASRLSSRSEPLTGASAARSPWAGPSGQAARPLRRRRHGAPASALSDPSPARAILACLAHLRDAVLASRAGQVKASQPGPSASAGNAPAQVSRTGHQGRLPSTASIQSANRGDSHVPSGARSIATRHDQRQRSVEQHRRREPLCSGRAGAAPGHRMAVASIGQHLPSRLKS